MTRTLMIRKIACCILSACLIFISGCTNPLTYLEKIEIVKDLGSDELFRINDESCSMTEAKIFLVTQKNIYESTYGSEIWSSKLGGKVFSSYVKSDIKTFLTRFNILKLMAKEYGSELSVDDTRYASMAAEELYASFTEDEREFISCTQDDVFELFKDFRLIDVYLNEFTNDISMEISEDDARVITIHNILIRTTTLDAAGNVTSLDAEEKESRYNKALEIYELLVNGSDFDTLSQEYSASNQFEINLERDVMGEEFDNIAFSLEEGQVSEIIESEYGYHIIKCIDSYNEELTAVHKEELLYEYKSAYYEEAYDAFIQDVNAMFNDELWDDIALNVSLELSGQDFFTVYYNHFE